MRPKALNGQNRPLPYKNDKLRRDVPGSPMGGSLHPLQKIYQQYQKRSWSVCPHISDPEGLHDYYSASGSLMLLLGKCLCHSCYESILKKKDIQEFMWSCEHLTDKEFHEGLVQSLIRVNKRALGVRESPTGGEMDDWTWVSCPHVSNPGDLQRLYITCSPLFISEGFITCKDCFRVVPYINMYLQFIIGCEAMTDAQLQEEVFKHLYPINSKIIETVRCQPRTGLAS